MYPGHPELALHIIDGMMDQGFDVAHSKYLREGQSITHAVTFVYARILQGKNIPVIPVMQNTYYPPNQPRPRRSYEFGIGLRNAIETWKSNARVAVLASGGFSHFVLDEELDHKALKALQDKDVDAIASLPLERLQAGTSDIRNGSLLPERCSTWIWRFLITCPAIVPRREQAALWPLPNGKRATLR